MAFRTFTRVNLSLFAHVVNLLLASLMSIAAVLSVWVLSFAVAAMLAAGFIRLEKLSAATPPRPGLCLPRGQARFALSARVGVTLQRLNHRLDLYLARAFRNRADVGLVALSPLAWPRLYGGLRTRTPWLCCRD